MVTVPPRPIRVCSSVDGNKFPRPIAAVCSGCLSQLVERQLTKVPSRNREDGDDADQHDT